jgi:hypothetical protein
MFTVFEFFHELMARQTTPLELVSFLVVTTGLTLVVAGLGYFVLITVLWWARFRSRVQVKYHEVFLPSRSHFRAFLWEYLLAITTSLVLGLTIAEKEQMVAQVLEFDVADLRQLPDSAAFAHTMESLFPLHRLPGVEQGGESLAALESLVRDQAGAGQALYATNLLKPVLRSGRSDAVRAMVDLIVPQVLAETPGFRRVLRVALFWTCAGLILAYLLTLGLKRLTLLEKDPARKGAVQYGGTVRRLVTVAVCVALLFASPVLVEDRELIADSAMGALQHDVLHEPPTDALGAAIMAAIDRQYDQQGSIVSAGTEDVLRRLSPAVDRLEGALRGVEADLGGRLSALEAQLGAVNDSIREQRRGLADELRSLRAVTSEESARLRARLGTLAGDVASNTDRIAALEGLLGGLRENIEANGTTARQALEQARETERLVIESVREVRAQLAEFTNRELVLIEVSGTYALTSLDTGQDVVRGARSGLRWLSPGRYRLTTPRAGQETFNLVVGQPRLIRRFDPIG